MALLITIFPGRFEPPHKGHLKVYEYLQNISGKNTFVATSNFVNLNQSPLGFKDKQQIWTRHGVPSDRIVQVISPYKSTEILARFNKNTDIAIFAVGEKDSSRFNLRNVSSNQYFFPYKGNEKNLKPFGQHGYIIIVPQSVSTINGKVVSSTSIREMLGSPKYNKNQKKKFFTWIMGWFDIGLFEYLVNTFSESYKASLSEYAVPLKPDENETKKSASEKSSEDRDASALRKKELDQVKKDYNVEKKKNEFYKNFMQLYLKYTKPELEKRMQKLSKPV
jgi:hypothetical protein